MGVGVGNQSPLPLIDLWEDRCRSRHGWESVTSPFDRLTRDDETMELLLGISHLSL